MKDKVPPCNIRFVFQTKCKINIFFTFKNKISSFLHSSIVYKFQCGGSDVTSSGKTKRHFKVKISEHIGISVLNGEKVKCDYDAAIKQPLLCCNHASDFEVFLILTTNKNDFTVISMFSHQAL